MPSDFILQVGHSQIQLLKGDITAIAVDAIVNAANAELAGGAAWMERYTGRAARKLWRS